MSEMQQTPHTVRPSDQHLEFVCNKFAGKLPSVPSKEPVAIGNIEISAKPSQEPTKVRTYRKEVTNNSTASQNSKPTPIQHEHTNSGKNIDTLSSKSQSIKSSNSHKPQPNLQPRSEMKNSFEEDNTSAKPHSKCGDNCRRSSANSIVSEKSEVLSKCPSQKSSVPTLKSHRSSNYPNPPNIPEAIVRKTVIPLQALKNDIQSGKIERLPYREHTNGVVKSRSNSVTSSIHTGKSAYSGNEEITERVSSKNSREKEKIGSHTTSVTDSDGLRQKPMISSRKGSMDVSSRKGSMDGSSRKGSMDGSSRKESLDGSSRKESLDGSSRKGSLDGSSSKPGKIFVTNPSDTSPSQATSDKMKNSGNSIPSRTLSRNMSIVSRTSSIMSNIEREVEIPHYCPPRSNMANWQQIPQTQLESEEYLTCCSCKQEFDAETKQPLRLFCHHNMCERCVLSQLKSTFWEISCGKCSNKTVLPAAYRLQYLRINTELLGVLGLN